MSSFKIRPRLKHQIIGQQRQVEEDIKTSLERNSKDLSITYVPGHIYIKIKPEDQHFWSPQLHLSFEQDEEQVTIRGLYGPNPTVWAIFFFGYAALGILSLFLGMWGLSRWSLGMDASVLWSIPILASLAIFLYVIAQSGQKLGAQQMFDIHHAFEQVSGEHVRIL